MRLLTRTSTLCRPSSSPRLCESSTYRPRPTEGQRRTRLKRGVAHNLRSLSVHRKVGRGRLERRRNRLVRVGPDSQRLGAPATLSDSSATKQWLGSHLMVQFPPAYGHLSGPLVLRKHRIVSRLTVLDFLKARSSCSALSLPLCCLLTSARAYFSNTLRRDVFVSVFATEASITCSVA